MREELRRVVRDLRSALEAEADTCSAPHLLVPRAAPRKARASEILDRLANEIRRCRRCPLCRSRTRAVPGEGPSDARLMLIGEAPGQHEDLQGKPFVGEAGDLLEKMLAAIHISRDEVFIANVLKCRPPRNRNPGPDEVARCRHYLMAQIAAIAPPVILTLGRFSAQLLLETSRGILALRGTPRSFSYEGGTAVLLPTLHPAYLLRNAAAKREAWEDLKTAHRLTRERTGDWPPPLAAGKG